MLYLTQLAANEWHTNSLLERSCAWSQRRERAEIHKLQKMSKAIQMWKSSTQAHKRLHALLFSRRVLCVRIRNDGRKKEQMVLVSFLMVEVRACTNTNTDAISIAINTMAVWFTRLKGMFHIFPSSSFFLSPQYRILYIRIHSLLLNYAYAILISESVCIIVCVDKSSVRIKKKNKHKTKIANSR